MKQVYICFSTDILHNGHIRILQRAAELGEVTVGLLTDEVVASYKHYPLIPLEERIAMFEGLKYVSHRLRAPRRRPLGFRAEKRVHVAARHPQPPAPRHCGAWG